ncbi:hypothetical protein QRO11_11210 [Paracidovorax citrulli]|uniref:Uncharacterized protein n=1 Tax=Paracidovorax citrulli TaxID=80869 RepID=A0ABY9AW08_PARCI|nr:hypothetical protein [Paracidovorax citrulli]ATG92976.1 hypothetical protein CQB05_02065 [Paracidovorax citrulli]PVY67299.1 hypothetical protein C8E08_4738 [Paracidovorax citrulli]QCX09059.1 hypothetical protein APS58_0075 [Paracidovorax citrulli]REG68541.1 hypothetical protein C8E07_1654 [Paracidovorax citrulli]RLJ93098.1 hypothetical protein C8E06_1654 [Paracidovorax citrulli]
MEPAPRREEKRLAQKLTGRENPATSQNIDLLWILLPGIGGLHFLFFAVLMLPAAAQGAREGLHKPPHDMLGIGMKP